MKKIVSLLVSILILVLLYQFVDFANLLRILKQTDIRLLLVSLAILVVLVLLSGLRLHLIGHQAGFSISRPKAIEATFAANALNMVLPGKLGDLLKSTMLTDGEPQRLKAAIAISIWEKLSDLTMLFLFAAVSFSLAASNAKGVIYMGTLTLVGMVFLISGKVTGLVRNLLTRIPLFSGPKLAGLLDSWQALQGTLGGKRYGLPLLLLMSFAIWAGHIFHICLMARALGVSVDLDTWWKIAGLIPLAIVAGLVPLTFAGVGTRDAALVMLLGGLIGKDIAAALGVLFWLRYLLPGILGLPMIPKFMRHTMAHAADRKADHET